MRMQGVDEMKQTAEAPVLVLGIGNILLTNVLCLTGVILGLWVANR